MNAYDQWLNPFFDSESQESDKKQVAVIFGGFSSEYGVSLKSAYSVINAIDTEKYDIIMIGITREGLWRRYYGSVEHIPTDEWHTQKEHLSCAYLLPERGGWLVLFEAGDFPTHVKVDLVFPVLHGRYGEDGTIQGLCELAGVPVVGSGAAASALCMDKDRAQKIVSLAGIAVPKAVCFEKPPTGNELQIVEKELKLPVFVKPVKAGSSIGVVKVECFSKLKGAVEEAFSYDDVVLIEENVEGMEISCSVVGNDELIVGKVNEIEVDNGFFTYGEKYTLSNSRFHIPARIDDETEKRVIETVKKVYQVLGCKGYARIDMFVRPDGEVVFIEANTIPGFTEFSQFPRMMDAGGYSYPQTVEMLMELALMGSKK